MRKAIAVHSIFLVILMIMILISALIIFFKWWVPTETEATRASCTMKKVSYCSEWAANGYDEYTKPSPSWGERAPKGCEDLDDPILEPTSREDCI